MGIFDMEKKNLYFLQNVDLKFEFYKIAWERERK